MKSPKGKSQKTSDVKGLGSVWKMKMISRGPPTFENNSLYRIFQNQV